MRTTGRLRLGHDLLLDRAPILQNAIGAGPEGHFQNGAASRPWRRRRRWVDTRTVRVISPRHRKGQRTEWPTVTELPVGGERLLDRRQLSIDRRRQLRLPVLQRQLPRLRGPRDRQGFVAGARVRAGERQKIARRLGVTWLRELLELGDRFPRLPQHNQHAPQVEAGEPEFGATGHCVPVLLSGVAGETLALQDLAEVVVRVSVLRVDGDGQAVGFGRAIPLAAQAEQHAVIVVGIAEADARDGPPRDSAPPRDPSPRAGRRAR